MPRHPHVSPYSAGVTDSLYSPLVERARASGHPVAPLHVGDTFREPPESARAEAQSTSAHPGMHTYAPVRGLPELRRAFVEHLHALRGVRLDPEPLQVTAGATSGVAVAVNALLDVGDEVLLPAPYWPLVRGVVASRGAVPVEVPCFDRLTDPGFDLERELATRITPRTSALYLNSPNNPTGALLDDDQMRAAVRLAKKHDLWLFFDEAYEALAFDGPPRATFHDDDARDRAVVFHTLSKSHGIAGARIGFLHGPERVMPAVHGLQMHLAYCAAQPMQRAAIAALRDGEPWVRETRALYARAAAATARAFGCPTPRGGTFVFADVGHTLPEGALDASAFLERAADLGVLLTPGSVSGRDYGRFVRVCFTSAAPDVLDAALARLAPLVGAR